jgi:hypothetical protein
MYTDVTVRGLSLSDELVHYARRCCAELANHVGEDARCHVVFEARTRNNRPTVAVRIALVGDVLALSFDGDPDPFLAVRNASATLRARLEHPPARTEVA